MTAVAVQQRSHPRQQYSPRQSPRSSARGPSTSQSRSQTHTPSVTEADDNAKDSSSNGAASTISLRTPASNNSSRLTMANGVPILNRDSTPLHPIPNGSNGPYSVRDGKYVDQDRPTSAPEGRAENTEGLILRDSTNEDSDKEPARRRPKPLLQRSKSDFGPRGDDSDSQRQDSDSKDWGARHGFEDHYASEEYVSQLASVSWFWL